MCDLETRVQWNFGPPRVRIEEAAIDVAAIANSDYDAISLLAGACQTRRTTASRCLQAASARPRLRRRKWLIDVLRDVEQGTCSVLENSYLSGVERAHGLPRGNRQQLSTIGVQSTYRDVDYDQFGLVIELDGRLFHDNSLQRDADMARDLVSLVHGQRTARLGWGQVVDRRCQTAIQISALLHTGGWRGNPRPCGPDCAVRRINPVIPTRQAR